MQLYSLRTVGTRARKKASAQGHSLGWGHWVKGDEGERIYQSRCERCGAFVFAVQHRDPITNKLVAKASVQEIKPCPGP